MICETMPTRHSLTADPKRSDKNPFCALMTQLHPCIIYQSEGVVTFIRKLLQHSLPFSTCVKHFNLHNILITQCHEAACRLFFSLTVSLSSLTTAAFPCLAWSLSLSLYFISRLHPLFPLYPSPSHKEMWIEVWEKLICIVRQRERMNSYLKPL